MNKKELKASLIKVARQNPELQENVDAVITSLEKRAGATDTQFVRLVKQFSDAGHALNSYWQRNPNVDLESAAKGYPFRKSFDEVVMDINDWYHSVK